MCAAVLFLGISGLHWLYQFAEHARQRVLNVLLGAAMVASLAFLISVAFAYASRTVVTWDTPFVPVALCLNALVGGPVLALFCLRFSRWSPLESRVGGMLLALSSAALLANAGVYVAQGMSVLTMRNYLVSAEQLVPTYGAMATVFFLLAVAGVAVDALPLMRGRGISVASAAIASALVFAGIFVMRFAFYMMHMPTASVYSAVGVVPCWGTDPVEGVSMIADASAKAAHLRTMSTLVVPCVVASLEA